MRYFISFFMIGLLAVPAWAVTPAGQGRRSMSTQMVGAPRATQASMASMHVTGVAGNPVINNDGTPDDNTVPNDNTDSAVKPDVSVPVPVIDKREKEKQACLNGNIGIGNTFVWASRYSNTGNYASMIEDVENPENNTCFVRVELKSSDSKVNLSDVQGQYFEMGRTITCGDWADEKAIEKRILDAKKSARTWGTVGGAVGGAALGVGAMELFGNKLIGGAVEGQKSLSDTDLLISQLSVLKKEDATKFNDYMSKVRDLVKKCHGNSSIESCQNIEKYEAVAEYNFG